MSQILQKIAKNSVQKVNGGQTVQLESVWQENDVVIYFLRRFGCVVCRWIAKEMSRLQPKFDENNVKLVGVAPETLGLEEFQKLNLFSGELFIDEKKKCYTDLEFSTYSFFGALGAAMDKDLRDIASKAKQEGFGGNIQGDWYQMGGMLIVKKGGEVLKFYKQQKGSDHMSNQEILDVLGIKEKAKSGEEAQPECTDVCGLPPKQ
uniref:prostamide/prostaglandin F synthase-like n=1 Tax=Ciona intestinalis TaxID=7719 RepID=UPI000180BF87|nr:prostamide/prostaglandin F synthase-like [Ciona intestinalis]|eukprot:XP_009860017.1 prostamide/prostaglandin F synthase-like [Ciona intestinalis]